MMIERLQFELTSNGGGGGGGGGVGKDLEVE